jgi:hypothetical protein
MTAEIGLFEMCLTVVIVAKMRATQNMPVNAEKIKRGSITCPNLPSRPPYSAVARPQVNISSFCAALVSMAQRSPRVRVAGLGVGFSGRLDLTNAGSCELANRPSV